MITSLRLENFQSHKRTVLSFSPGLNVFIGKTNSGKTAIFRGFRKILRNQPVGTSFVSTWSNKCTITLNDAITRIIEIRRTEKSSTIVTNCLHLGLDKFDKLGRGLPPPELFKALGISPPLKIAGIEEDFNFILQKDPSFLTNPKAYPPSTVAKFFDHISGVGVLNTCVQEAKARIRTTEKNVKNLEERKENLEKRLQELSYVTPLKELENFARKLSVLVERKDTLIELRSKLRVITQKLRQDAAVQGIVEVLATYAPKFSEFIKILSLLNSLKNLEKRVSIVLPDFSSFTKKLQILEALVKLRTTTKFLKSLDKLYSLYQTSIHQLKIYQVLIQLYIIEESLLEIPVQITTLENLEVQYKNTYKDVLEKLRVCPVCGQSTISLELNTLKGVL